MSDPSGIVGVMKRCIDCHVEKPLSDFPSAPRRSDGHGSYCKVCMLMRSRVSYRKRMAAKGRTVQPARVLPDGTRRCPDCGEVKALEEFPRNKNGSKGRGSYCKPCHNARGVASKQRSGGFQEYHRRHRYGMAVGEFDEMLREQGGLCALCGERPAEHVDHDHLFGHVRGILCFNCNGGLGQFKDRVDIMAKAIDYLERTTWRRTLVCTGVYRLRSPRPAAAASATS